MPQNKWYIKEAITLIDNDMKSKLEETGDLVMKSAKKNAPVKTGNLRDSITYDLVGKETVVIGSDVVYSPYIEFGTKYIKPYAFLRRAIDENKSKILKIFSKKVKT